MPVFAKSIATPTSVQATAVEQRLHDLLRALNTEQQTTLLRFAEFLVASAEELPLEVDEIRFPLPEDLQRPEAESVIMAIKRLTATYPMINKEKLLHKASDLMAEHVTQGRAAADVIDELEQLFAEHYHQLRNDFEQNCPTTDGSEPA